MTVVTSDVPHHSSHPSTHMTAGDGGIDGDTNADGSGFGEGQNNSNNGYGAISVGEFLPVVHPSTVVAPLVVSGEGEPPPPKKKKKTSMRKTKIVVEKLAVDPDQQKLANKYIALLNVASVSATSSSTSVSGNHSPLRPSDSNSSTDRAVVSESIIDKTSSSSDRISIDRSSAGSDIKIDNLVQQLRDECELLLTRGNSTERLLELYR